MAAVAAVACARSSVGLGLTSQRRGASPAPPRVSYTSPWSQNKALETFVVIFGLQATPADFGELRRVPDPTGWSARGKRRKRRSSTSTWVDYLSIYRADQPTYAHNVAGDALYVARSASHAHE